MAQDTDTPDRDGIDKSDSIDESDGIDESDRIDESDDRMFTDSFAPREQDPPEPSTEGPLEEAEELLPQAEPVEGPAPLP